jgi:O-antigen/teichoic acid export membrane protein
VNVVDDITERRTSKWDIRNAPRNYVWLILFQFSGAAFGFLAVWLLTHHFEPAGYGVIVAVLAASQIVQIFLNWSTVAVVRFGVDEFVETAYIARTFWVRGAIFLVNLLLLIALAGAWYPPLAKYLKLSAAEYWLVVAHFVATALWVHVQMGLQAAKLLREQGFLQALERVIIATAVVAFYVTGALDLSAAVIAYVIAAAAMAGVGVYRLRRLIFTSFAVEFEFIKKIFIYSVPLLPYWIIGYMSSSFVDAVFISTFLSTADLGVYGIAIQISGLAMQIPTLANTILFPLFITQQAESGEERSFFFFRHVLPGLVLVWGLGCGVAAFLSFYLMPLVFDASYSGATLPLWILLAGTTFWVPVAVGYAALANAMSSTYMSLIASAFSAAANLGANFYLIPRYGMAGCAWATMLAYASSAIVFGILLNRGSRLPLSWTFVAFLPSVAGSLVLFTWGSPLAALSVTIISTAAIATFARKSLGHMSAFINSLRRPSGEAHQAA